MSWRITLPWRSRLLFDWQTRIWLWTRPAASSKLRWRRGRRRTGSRAKPGRRCQGRGRERTRASSWMNVPLPWMRLDQAVALKGRQEPGGLCCAYWRGVRQLRSVGSLIAGLQPPGQDLPRRGTAGAVRISAFRASPGSPRAGGLVDRRSPWAFKDPPSIASQPLVQFVALSALAGRAERENRLPTISAPYSY